MRDAARRPGLVETRAEPVWRRRQTSSHVEHQPDINRHSDAIVHCGATVWFTGLSASGKSTLGNLVAQALIDSGRRAYVLDGDRLRDGLCSDLSFEPADRAENVRRVGEVARLFADAGLVAVVTLISPYRADRDRARQLHEREALPFVEVYVNTPLSECQRRDPKGLYRKAREGALHNLTGTGAPYESPLAPDAEISPEMDPDTAVQTVLAALLAATATVESQTRQGETR